jgi:hypothetical protein
MLFMLCSFSAKRRASDMVLVLPKNESDRKAEAFSGYDLCCNEGGWRYKHCARRRKIIGNNRRKPRGLI